MSQFQLGIISLALAGVALVAAREVATKVAGVLLILAACLLSGLGWDVLGAIGGVTLLLVVAAGVAARFAKVSRGE